MFSSRKTPQSWRLNLKSSMLLTSFGTQRNRPSRVEMSPQTVLMEAGKRQNRSRQGNTMLRFVFREYFAFSNYFYFHYFGSLAFFRTGSVFVSRDIFSRKPKE
jgi:hypothetical protein